MSSLCLLLFLWHSAMHDFALAVEPVTLSIAGELSQNALKDGRLISALFLFFLFRAWNSFIVIGTVCALFSQNVCAT